MKRIVRVFTEWSDFDRRAGMHFPRIMLLCAVILLAVAAAVLIFERMA